MSEPQSLKSRTAGSLKWNLADRLSTQVLYAVTGIVLARLLSQEDFGLVGAVLVFQAFAGLIVDSGFSYAILQKEKPTQLDYSTVLWFNLGSATVLYGLLFAAAPFVAWCFGGDERLVPLSRVMFLTLILNAAVIVQINRQMKAMAVRIVAIANFAGLACGGAVGIACAVAGYGAWAMVWQTLTLGAVKAAVLWIGVRWRPAAAFSWQVIRSFWGISSRMMATSFLNTVFLNIYSLVIGNRTGLVSLGYYTQADKWSKMGITSLSQTLTSTFVPTLSAVQADSERFAAVAAKMNRFTSYVAFPALIGLALMATDIFHALFGAKWDASILLFQLLLVRGIFMVFTGLYNNYLLALGRAGLIVRVEILRDTLAAIALVATLPWIHLSTESGPVLGVTILIGGQLLTTAVTWIYTLFVTTRAMKFKVRRMLGGMAPYCALTAAVGALMYAAGSTVANPWAGIAVQSAVGLGLYLLVNHLAGSKVQHDILDYFRGKLA